MAFGQTSRHHESWSRLKIGKLFFGRHRLSETHAASARHHFEVDRRGADFLGDRVFDQQI
jgi:hypothetical protein